MLRSGEVVATSALHLTDGCLGGTLDRFILPVVDQQAPIENVRLTATLDSTGFSNMTVGATADVSTSELIFEAVGRPFEFAPYWDIRADLNTTGTLECNAISLTLELGGVTE